MFFLIVVLLAIFAAVCICNFRCGVFLFLAALPAYLARFQISLAPFYKGGGLPTTMLEAMFWVLFAVWIMRMVRRGKPADSPDTSIGVIGAGIRRKLTRGVAAPIVLFFIASIIAIFVSPNHFAALGVWRAYFLEPMMFFLMLTSDVARSSNLWRRRGLGTSDTIGNWKLSAMGGSAFGGEIGNFAWPLAVSVFYISAVAIAQRFFGWAIPPPWQSELRVTSVFDYPNAVGLYVAPVLMLILGLWITRIFVNRVSGTMGGATSLGGGTSDGLEKKSPSVPLFKRGRIVFLAITFFLGIVAIILAKSDGAIVGLAAGLAVFGLIYNRKTRLAVAIAIMGISILILIVPGAGQRVADQFLLGDWSGYVRQTMWSETWAMLKDNPLFGAGLAGYQTVFAPYHRAQGIEIFMYPHNIFLNFWSELGMMGLIGFLWMILAFFRKIISNFQFPISKLFALVALSSMVVILVQGLVDAPYFKNDLAFLFWIIFAMPFLGDRAEGETTLTPPRPPLT